MSGNPYLPSRRRFLQWGIAAAASFSYSAVMPAGAFAAQKDWRQAILDRDRWLSLERGKTGEKAVFLYYRYGKGFDPRGYDIACHLLRDVTSGVTYRMDARLIDLLYIIQVWLRLKKLPYHIIINSGYRTPEYNAKLAKSVKKSQHVLGRAADIRIPGLSVEDLNRLARAVGVGGVGIYPGDGFVHVDVAGVRTWKG